MIKQKENVTEHTDCEFCNIALHKKPVKMIREDDLVCAFLDMDPINEGHILIIPKKHVPDIDEMDERTLNRMMVMAKELVAALKEVFHPEGYSIMQNGGVFNDTGHFHLHVFPRYRGDGFGWTFGENDFGNRLEETKRKLTK